MFAMMLQTYEGAFAQGPGLEAHGIDFTIIIDVNLVQMDTMSNRPVSHRRFLPSPANSVLSRRQPTHVG